MSVKRIAVQSTSLSFGRGSGERTSCKSATTALTGLPQCVKSSTALQNRLVARLDGRKPGEFITSLPYYALSPTLSQRREAKRTPRKIEHAGGVRTYDARHGHFVTLLVNSERIFPISA